MSDYSSLAGKNIVVTGGSGYIGTHTVIELLAVGAKVFILDDFSNSHPAVMDVIEEISGVRVPVAQIDLKDYAATLIFFKSQPKFDACIHFAGFKAVGESCDKPLEYFDNNIAGTINLLKALNECDCRNLVFSSSATVYGVPEKNPIDESAHLSTTNPYGLTKLVIEQMLRDLVKGKLPEGKEQWRIALLRYFNPVGAHASGKMGEDPNGIPNNLVPYITQVAVGKRPHLNVFGNDWPTHDGTGVRDYIHVVDLALGHLAALANAIFGEMPSACEAYNLGTGTGYSVLDVHKAAEIACGHSIPYKIVDRRPGDVSTCYADPTKAHTQLKWKAKYNLQDAINDAWRWQKNNPNGFKK